MEKATGTTEEEQVTRYPPLQPANHIVFVLYPTAWKCCTCGESELVQLPMSLRALVAAGEAFAKRHEHPTRCTDPGEIERTLEQVTRAWKVAEEKRR